MDLQMGGLLNQVLCSPHDLVSAKDGKIPNTAGQRYNEACHS
jgi:hypothetical protein